ncbi:MAG: substrate-binding domain-containing protein [Pseudonocardiaceae bacterium]|nr:substrate-binding domain-containing protein [Pseudonocardiaceae bacterium]
MATIHDVAARAGVSTATVSRALNGKSTVDPELAARVAAAADELDYRPNAVARSLRLQATTVWALIISDIENPFFTAVARGVEDVAQAAGHSVVLCNSDEDPAKEARYLQVAVAERVAGVVLSPTAASTDIAPLAEHGIPVVAIDRPLPEIDAVLVGSRQGAADATAHLLAAGYDRVACVTGPRRVSTAEDRLAGYGDALHAAGRRVSSRLVRHADFKVPGGRRAVEQLLGAARPPDALFVANSLMAIGALQSLAARGLTAGRDVGMVAFDDAPWTQLVNPPISVVAQPAYAIGETAGRLLTDRGDESRTVTLDAELIVRGSSDPG